MKPPARSKAPSKASTRRRRSASPAQILSRYAARSAAGSCSAASKAASSRGSSWLMKRIRHFTISAKLGDGFLSTFLFPLDLLEQPGAAVIPPAVCRRDGNPKHLGGFFCGEANKIAELDKF